MGWLFGKKKKVPVAPAMRQPLDDKALMLPSRHMPPPQPVMKHDEVKKAAGVSNLPPLPSVSAPRKPQMEMAMPPVAKQPLTPPPPPKAPMPTHHDNPYLKDDRREELYIKVEAYQRVLGELDDIHKKLSHLKEISKKLEQSEFNEEKSFNQLRKSIRTVHDNVLSVDKTIFKV